jgi:hypothetical protein
MSVKYIVEDDKSAKLYCAINFISSDKSQCQEKPVNPVVSRENECEIRNS